MVSSKTTKEFFDALAKQTADTFSITSGIRWALDLSVCELFIGGTPAFSCIGKLYVGGAASHLR